MYMHLRTYWVINTIAHTCPRLPWTIQCNPWMPKLLLYAWFSYWINTHSNCGHPGIFLISPQMTMCTSLTQDHPRMTIILQYPLARVYMDAVVTMVFPGTSMDDHHTTLLKMSCYSSITMCQYWDIWLIY